MLVLIRGAGDIATGIALRLHRAHMHIVMTELPEPTAIRRTVCFSEAVRFGSATVEGVYAKLAANVQEAREIAESGTIALLIDPAGTGALALKPDVLVDAILAKRNLGTKLTDAPVVIGIGPGFTAAVDCHAAVETMRGHYLGRVLYQGSPLPNTGTPGRIGGYMEERLLRAPCDGVFLPQKQIGERVCAGDTAATVNGEALRCTIDGILRGILPAGTVVRKGMKSGDIDPRCERAHCDCASDKALAVGGGVLEAILHIRGANP